MTHLQKSTHHLPLALRSGVLGLLALTVLSGCGSGGTDQPGSVQPGVYAYRKPAGLADGWSVAHAADLGVDVTRLEALMNAMPTEFDVVDSLAIAYQGKLVLHETVRKSTNVFDSWVGNTNPDMHLMFSATKSVASLAVGIAIEQGIFSGLAEPYLALFPYVNYDNWDERKNDMLLGDLLTMRAGLQWNEWSPPYSSPDNQMIRFYETAVDFSKAVLDLPLDSDPGSTFAYNTPAVVSLGQAIENAGPLTLIDFSIANVFAPLDIVDVEVLTTPTNLPDVGRGLYLATRDFLKFGQLYADGGVWNGNRIVSENWVNESLLAHVPLSWSQPNNFDWKLNGYGYLWWTGYFEVDGQQVAAYMARGYGEQNLFVLPALELVVAVYSHDYEASAGGANQSFKLVRRFVIPALP